MSRDPLKFERPKIMDTSEWKQAELIFNRWHNDQLRPEGRASIYVDDEAALIGDIAEALIEAKLKGNEA